MTTSLTGPILLAQADARNTFGSMFVGVIFAAVLFGVVIVQTFIYFQTHRRTGMSFFKLVVLYLWTLDALHMSLIVHFVYYYLVPSYANFETFTEIVWTAKLHIIPAIFIVWSIHSLYAYRIWIVSRGRPKVLPIMVVTIVTLNLGVGIVTILKVYRCHQFGDLHGMEWLTLLFLSVIGFTDFVIASSLAYLLATSRTGFSSTDSFLTKLMVYTIHTGCLISMCSMATIVACAMMPGNFVYMSIQFVGAKLYVNSFLALMNARYYQRSHTDTTELIVRSGVYQPDLRTCGGRLHMPQVHSHDEESHPTRSDQATSTMSQAPIAVKMEMSSVSKSILCQ